MKIFEIVTEADSAYEKGKAFGQRLVSPSQWIKPDADSTYEKGKDFGRKLVTPSEWFKSNKSSPDAEVDDKPKKQTPTKIESNKVKDVVNSLLRDEPRYNEDIKLLKTLYSQLQDGSYTTTIDKSALMQSIKTAYSGGQLSNDDKTMLSKFAATL